MLVAMGMAGLRCGLLAGLGWFLAACVQPPAAERIVGPDGTQMLHVHCGKEQVACFQIAGERCPHGYDLSPIFDPHDGNFLVRCRNLTLTRKLVVAAPQALPSTSPTNAVPHSAADDSWPPSEVATPTEPWPTPASSALPAAPRTSNGAVDLSY